MKHLLKIICCWMVLLLSNNIIAEDLLTDTDIANKVIDETKAIGLVPGSYSVSLSGAANYSIPIIVTDGVNGLQPSIGVAYSSQSGNGLLGYGWSLNALSVITYDGLDFYHDDQTLPSCIDCARPFVLDGQRLMLTNGNQGTNSSEYRTEAESFSKITAQGTTAGCSSCPDWFKVETKSGLTLEYGKLTAKQKDANNKPIAWYLSKIIDNYGNYIEYTYTIVDGTFLLDEIIYNQGGTGTTIASAYANKVQFEYTTRTDENKYFSTDGAGNTTTHFTKKLLSTIKVYAEGTFVRKYKFNYGSDGLYSYLNEVELFADDAETKAINSTIFKYGQTEISPNNYNYNYVNNTLADMIPLDFNGDSFDDLFIAYYIKDANGKKYSSYKVYENNTTGGFTLAKNTSLPTTYYSKTLYMQFHVGDLDGDGRKEIIAENRTATLPKKFKLNGYYTIKKQDNYDTTSYYNITAGNIIAPYYFFVDDFDGDGKDDIIHAVKSTTANINLTYLSKPDDNSYNTQIGYYDLNNYNYLEDSENISYTFLYADTLFATYFDGDAKADFVFRINVNGGSKEYVATINKHNVNNNTYYWYTPLFYDNTMLSTLNYVADFNGDSKADILQYGTSWKIAYSTGKGISLSNFTFTEAVSTTNLQNGTEVIKTADFNHDGKADILHYYSNSGTPTYAIYYSSGTNFTRKTYTAPHSFSLKPSTIADFNADGNADVLDTILNNSSNFYIVQFNPKSKERLLEKVKDGYERTTVFNYKLFTEGGLFYDYTAANAYPLRIVNPKSFGVEKVTQPDGTGNNNNVFDVTYSYKDANSHALKGFLGFKNVKVLNELSNVMNESSFDILTIPSNDLYLQVPVETKSYINSTPAKMISESNSFVYDLTTYANKRFWLKNTSGTTKQYIDETLFSTIVENKSFDSDGNVTNTSININNGLQTITTATSGTMSSAGTWLPTQPQYVTTTTNYNSDTYTQQTKYDYNTKGQIREAIAFNGTDKSITTTNEYDANNGMLTKVTIDPSDATARFTKYEYHDNKRTLKKVKNSLDDVTTEIVSYEPRWNLPTRTNSLYSNYYTTNTYDDWGNLTSSTQYPNYITTSYEFDWDINSSTNSIYYTSVSGNKIPDNKTLYNNLGAVVKTEVKNHANATVSSFATYNAFGLQATSKTLDANGSDIETIYQYNDDYQRLTDINNGISTNTYDYDITTSGLYQITTTASGFHNKIYEKDATGKLKKVSDGGADINYSYYANGQPKTITTGTGGSTTTMEYDARAMQTKLEENNSGTTTYKYNGFGELIEQKDNIGNKYTLEYDVLGRLTSRLLDPANTSEPDVNTVYNYVTSPTDNGFRQLANIKVGSTTLESYAYGTLHRPNSHTEKIDNTDYVTTMTYNNDDNSINSITYPNSVTINYVYNSIDGFLEQIKHGSTILYKTGTTNNTAGTNILNQITDYTLGNGKTSSIGYNDLGMPTNFTTTGVQNLTMEYELTNGNLINRTDVLNNQKEEFDYSNNLDALTQIEVDNNFTNTNNTPTQYNIGYTTNNNGNILSKYIAGSEYSYDLNKVHAVVKTQADCNDAGATGLQTITYTPFNQPKTITQGNFTLDYTYNTDYNRNKSELKEGTTTKATRYYVGNYEKLVQNGTTQHLYYIQSPVGLCAIIKKQGSTTNYFYTYTDHLGSIVSMTNNTGAVVAKQSFDAWGRHRNPVNWDDYNQSNFTIPANNSTYYWLTRGYTGHEMLNEFNLINMNGRMYDPIVGRMLSPDNYVQDPTNSQNYNRYSYVLNNPLKYIDPSGMILYDATELLQTMEQLNNNSRAFEAATGGGSNGYNYLGPYSLFANNPSYYTSIYGGSTWMQQATGAAYNEGKLRDAFYFANNQTRKHNNGTGNEGSGDEFDLRFRMTWTLSHSTYYMNNATAGNGIWYKPNSWSYTSNYMNNATAQVGGGGGVIYTGPVKGKDIKGAVYIHNNSNHTIYFKPEADMIINGVTYSNEGAYPLAPNQSWNYRIDGVAVPHLEINKVYKVVDGQEVFITNDDIYTKTIPTDNAFGIIKSTIADLLRGGWYPKIPAPKWKNLFNKSKK